MTDKILKLTKKLTKRPIAPGAERWLSRPIKCLDHGFVYLVDYMGNDYSIVQAARVSYGVGTKKVSQDRGLIRYLRRHMHTTPFEMIELKFHVKMPIFVARQWVRHRTANINEYSGRYSVMTDQFHTPSEDQIKGQSSWNHQARSNQLLVPKIRQKIRSAFKLNHARSYALYREMLADGFARELARTILPISNYTQWYWKIDLHNMMHFLRLRLDDHAQYEIQIFARAIAKIVKTAFPFAWEAFEDYQLKGESLSRYELGLIKASAGQLTTKRFTSLLDQLGLDNKRERTEIERRFKDWGILRQDD